MNRVSHRALRQAVLAGLAVLSIIYLGQGVIVHGKLRQIDASVVELHGEGEKCNAGDCIATWTLVPHRRFLLLGHILRTHSLYDAGTGEQVLPISRITGTVADGWVRLRVYSVDPNSTYRLVATRPQATKLGYFMGLMPRSTDHEGILSIPDVGPAISIITGTILAFLLATILAAAFIGSSSGMHTRERTATTLRLLGAAALLAATAAFISMGILDSFLPEGEGRNKLLRISTILSLSLPIVAQLPWISSSRPMLKTGLAGIVIVAVALICWPWVRAGQTWAGVMAALIVVGAVAFLRMRLWLAAAVWSLFIFDAAKIAGLLQIFDYPPVYVFNASIFSGLTIVAGDLGGFATIAMAGLAYRRFKRDLTLAAIQQSLERSGDTDTVARLASLRSQLPNIAALTGAGQIAVTFSLPLGRPVTMSFDRERALSQLYDDGRIPGAVTLRCLVYGDEAMFESFAEFAQRLRLPSSPQHRDAKFFCSIALRVNDTVVGTMMLTKFADAHISRLKAAHPRDFLQEERETILLLGSRLSQSLSTLVVQNLDATTALSSELQVMVRSDIAGASGPEDFLARFASSVGRAAHIKVMVHEQLEARGVLCASYGLEADEVEFFASNPLNLSHDAVVAYGPSVVAFREGKSSYVRDINSIMDRLHPKSQAILRTMAVTSIGAVPLRASDRHFVATLLSSAEHPVFDPATIAVVESTEALFVAAVEVMSQKSSVFALGRLASRLIADNEVREKILSAARGDELPTIVGSVRQSFLLLFDLAGSSDLPRDDEAKAKAYGMYYDAVNRAAQSMLGGTIRKTIGDAVIITWDGTAIDLGADAALLGKLLSLVELVDETACSIGCRGTRAILHFGDYFYGLVGTQTIGQIDVIGNGIDEVCKIETEAKRIKLGDHPLQLAVTPQAVAKLPLLRAIDYQRRGLQAMANAEASRFAVAYAAARPQTKAAATDATSDLEASDAA